jgi:hypothetical protein
METNARVHSSLFIYHETNFSCLSPTLLLLLLPLLLLLVSWLTMFLKCTFIRLEFVTHYILVKRIGDEIILKNHRIYIHTVWTNDSSSSLSLFIQSITLVNYYKMNWQHRPVWLSIYLYSAFTCFSQLWPSSEGNNNMLRKHYYIDHSTYT